MGKGMPRYPQLNLPRVSLRVKRCDDGVWRVYDRLRGKFVALTPEEWVRQHFVEFLVCDRGYPQGLLANEVSLSLNTTRRRCDTVMFYPAANSPSISEDGADRAFTLGNLRPMVIVEYKSPEIEITQKVFDQIARYNLVMRAPVLIVSNGLRHFCCLTHRSAYVFLREIPAYGSLLQVISRSDVPLATGMHEP